VIEISVDSENEGAVENYTIERIVEY